jgi:long-chain acyl-CoA synthetase
MTALEHTLNIHIPDELMAKAFTVKELILEMEKLAPGEALQGAPVPPVKSQVLWNDILNEKPTKEMIKKLYITPSRMTILGVLLFSGILRIAFRMFWQLKIFGTKNIPKGRGCILCVNHGSYLDGFAVVASAPANLRNGIFFVGFRALFEHPFIKTIIKFIRVIPIDPGAHFVKAMQACSYVLKAGKIVCIFPEAERTIDGKVQEFKKGVGILSKELNIPLVPVCITGSYESWPRTKRLPRPHPIKITFGRPFDFEELKKEGLRLGIKDDYEAIASGIREEVIKLKGKQ